MANATERYLLRARYVYADPARKINVDKKILSRSRRGTRSSPQPPERTSGFFALVKKLLGKAEQVPTPQPEAKKHVLWANNDDETPDSYLTREEVLEALGWARENYVIDIKIERVYVEPVSDAEHKQLLREAVILRREISPAEQEILDDE
ncbi:hypothetical protein KW798_02300 [Candidatus Parcubacteria bacterium]|nr:hypothetical protein [Candidatus Parcubacteria bacterium]